MFQRRDPGQDIHVCLIASRIDSHRNNDDPESKGSKSRQCSSGWDPSPSGWGSGRAYNDFTCDSRDGGNWNWVWPCLCYLLGETSHRRHRTSRIINEFSTKYFQICSQGAALRYKDPVENCPLAELLPVLSTRRRSSAHPKKGRNKLQALNCASWFQTTVDISPLIDKDLYLSPIPSAYAIVTITPWYCQNMSSAGNLIVSVHSTLLMRILQYLFMCRTSCISQCL